MKRNFKLAGLAVMMTVAALSFTACGGENNEAATEETVTEEVIEIEDEAGDTEVIEIIEEDTTAVEGKCGEGKCGEGKCGDGAE